MRQLQNGSLIKYIRKIYKQEPVTTKKQKKLGWEVRLLIDFLIQDPIPERLKENHVAFQANPLYVKKKTKKWKFHDLIDMTRKKIFIYLNFSLH